MAILKCKMCGGNLDFTEGQSYGTCDSCGSTMTLPKANDERILNLFNRANHYRIQNEFDKALATYESILEEDSSNAEAYWGCVLSKYGIEYVEDARTHERIPTCHRVQNESILADLDYQKAIQNAPDNHSQKLYETEAEKISEIQKGILNIARNEKPYDIFICYKETDATGQRTIDSTLAQDIYYQLTNEGYKVFFSRITLEDKLGQEYEPYIFAALNSAKVMLVIGTKAEYFNSVWVKNEWARFLEITKKDRNKLLIPCYREMDAYELPEELSLFQSQDMGKIGFLQDLSRGIHKIISDNKSIEQSTEKKSSDFNLENIIVMAKTSLETSNWTEALGYANTILNKDATSAEAWFVKMKAIEKQIHSENYEELRLKEIKICGQNAIKYASDKDKLSMENTLRATYENSFEGYLKKFNETINATEVYFQFGWGNIQYTDLQANIAKVKKIYISFAEMSADLLNTPKISSLIKPIYKTLGERLEISKARINQWRPQYRSEQGSENQIMSSKFDIIKSNLAKTHPEIFKVEYEALHEKTSVAQNSLEKHKKAYKIAMLIGAIAGTIGLLPLLLSNPDDVPIFFWLLTSFGYMCTLVCLLALPMQIAQDKGIIKKCVEKEENWKREINRIGIKIDAK